MISRVPQDGNWSPVGLQRDLARSAEPYDPQNIPDTEENLNRAGWMRRDHLGPEDGKIFVSLNLTREEWLSLSVAIVSLKGFATTEAALAHICHEWHFWRTSVREALADGK